MEFSHVHQRFLFISLFSLAVFNSALFKCMQGIAAEEAGNDLSPGSSPNSQPVSSPSYEPELSPTPEPTLLPLNHVSFPPSGSDPPAEQISPSVLESPDEEVPFLVSNRPISEDIGGFVSSLHKVDTDSSPDNVDPDLKKICDSTDYPSLCISTISPLVKGKTDVKSVLGVAMEASNELAKFAFAMAKKLADSPATPHDIVSILNNCKDSYDDALYNFQQAKEALDTQDIGTMNTMLSAVITDIGDCEDEFSGVNFDSPLLNFAEKLTNMTSNCLAIVSLVK